MVSDSELVDRLREIIRGSDLTTTTAAGVRRRLEEELSIDLHERKRFIREQIDIFLEELRDCQVEEAAEQERECENGESQEEGKSEKEESDEAISGKERSSNVDKYVKKKGGFAKPCALSPQLQELFGVSKLARTEVVKKIWVYIREKKLQNPKDKRKILCDECLHQLFRVHTIDMFKMNKALSKHIWPLDEAEEQAEEEVCENEEAKEENSEEEEEEEEEGEEEEEEADEDRSSKDKRSNKKDKEVKKRGGGFTKPCALSPQLQEVIGVPELARTEVVKRLWSYIREKNLQNPKNKRKILCDEALHGLFGVSSIDMFQMNKALSKHIWPLDEEATPATYARKERKRGGREDLDQPKKKEKLLKGGGSGLTAPLPLSDALMKFFDSGENELSRADVVKRMWQYIKENELQDPSDRRTVLCDEKLKELFKVDSFYGFGISKLLTEHLLKIQR